MRWTRVGAAALLVVGCSLSPLQNRIHPGKDAFVLVAGTGTDQHVDLFALLPGGGEVQRVTFTAMVESAPRLTRQGDVVAFLRHGVGTRRAAGELVVLNLLNGAERTLEIPDSAGALSGLGWSDDQRLIYVATATGPWVVAAPPAAPDARPVDVDQRAAADTALALWVGTPRFAQVARCDSGGLCITGPSGVAAQLSSAGAAPSRWGRDSVAWLEGDVVVIRPLGPGPTRRLEPDPTRLHDLTAVSYATP